MRKVFVIGLILLVIGSTSILGGAATILKENQIHSNEVAAIEQYQKLLDRLEAEDVQDKGFEAYYGGAFLNGDGNLVVCVTEDYPMGSGLAEAYTGNGNILFQRVKYARAALLHEQAYIGALSMKYANEPRENIDDEALYVLVHSISGLSVYEQKNVLSVEIVDLNQEKIETFRKYFSDKEFIVFEEGTFA